jgi:hypothetical protein
MKDTSNSVRTIYVNALNGNISYNGKDVPVYGQDPFRTLPKNYVIISSITENAANTNNSFQSIVSVDIDIFSEQYRINDPAVVDNIAGQILNILIPNPGIVGFSDTDFIVYPTARINSVYLPLQNYKQFSKSKINKHGTSIRCFTSN